MVPLYPVKKMVLVVELQFRHHLIHVKKKILRLTVNVKLQVTQYWTILHFNLLVKIYGQNKILQMKNKVDFCIKIHLMSGGFLSLKLIGYL